MSRQVRIWIDHGETFVVFIGAGEETEAIESGKEKGRGKAIYAGDGVKKAGVCA